MLSYITSNFVYIILARYFEYPFALLLPLILIPLTTYLLRKKFVEIKEDEIYAKRRKLVQKIMTLTRAILIVLLCIAIASPYTYTQKMIEGDPVLRIVVDNSTSMQAVEKLKSTFVEQLKDKIPVEMSSAGIGDISNTGEATLSALGPYESVLVYSDGRINTGAQLGDVGLFAIKLNSTINGLQLKDEASDAGIVLEGPQKAMTDTEIAITAKIGRVNKKTAPVKITLDGKTIYEQDTAETEIVLPTKLSQGYHKLTAEITQGDDFPQNNIFYKTIKTVEKPKLLFITQQSSPFLSVLRQVFTVESTTSLPGNLEPYYSIIINDMPATTLDPYTEKLGNYVREGNGLLVIGGRTSYNNGRYRYSQIETLLPVITAKAGRKEGEMNIVIIIDKSGSTGSSFGTAAKQVDLEKAMAIDVLEKDIKSTYKVGVVAFDTQSYTIGELDYLLERRPAIEDRIARIQDGGGTVISMGVLKALDMLRYASGSKNIILISDGMTQQENNAIESAKQSSNEGVRIYTVSVGDKTNDVMMMRLAEITGGIFFKATDASRLSLLFGDPEKTNQENTPSLVALNSNHYITKDLPLNALVGGFNEVVPKLTSQLLVTTSGGDPVLTVWRAGLGKVASLSTDDGSMWAAQLLTTQNAKLLTRSVNWLIGEPDRKANEKTDITDSRTNQPVTIIVKSPSQPKADNITFYKTAENTYYATTFVTETGFKETLGATFAINRPEEYDYLGMSEDLQKTVQLTGGKMYTQDQADEIVKNVKSRSRRTTTEKHYHRNYLVTIALILFLLEIFIRRWLRRE